MEELCAFIPELDSINCVPLLPIYVLISEQSLKVLLDNGSEIPFCWKKWPVFFQGV